MIEWREVYYRLPSGKYDRILEIREGRGDWFELARTISDYVAVYVAPDKWRGYYGVGS